MCECVRSLLILQGPRQPAGYSHLCVEQGWRAWMGTGVPVGVSVPLARAFHLFNYVFILWKVYSDSNIESSQYDFFFQKEFLFEGRIRRDVKQSTVRAVHWRQMEDLLFKPPRLIYVSLIWYCLLKKKPSVLMLRPCCNRASDTKWRLIETYYNTSRRPVSQATHATSIYSFFLSFSGGLLNSVNTEMLKLVLSMFPDFPHLHRKMTNIVYCCCTGMTSSSWSQLWCFTSRFIEARSISYRTNSRRKPDSLQVFTHFKYAIAVQNNMSDALFGT